MGSKGAETLFGELEYIKPRLKILGVKGMVYKGLHKYTYALRYSQEESLCQ